LLAVVSVATSETFQTFLSSEVTADRVLDIEIAEASEAVSFGGDGAAAPVELESYLIAGARGGMVAALQSEVPQAH
jgi:hypothetical protein